MADTMALMNCDPPGLKFFDRKLNREMKLVYAGHWAAGWIVYKHPDGQWVTLRKATTADLDAINSAVVRAHHSDQLTPSEKVAEFDRYDR